jgi:hypothetical protein
LAAHYERAAGNLLASPWDARDDWMEVVLDRTPDSIAGFLARHGRGRLDPAERVRTVKLLELQREALLMQASCGWFFDDVSGLETVLVLKHAARALRLAEETGAGPLEPDLLRRLAEATSNLPEQGDGRRVFEHHVRPAEVDLERAAAHHAAAVAFGDGSDPLLARAFDIGLEAGRIAVTSRLTLEHAAYEPEASPTLESLLPDARRRILARRLEAPRREFETLCRELLRQHAVLLDQACALDGALPAPLAAAAAVVFDLDLRQALEQEPLDPSHLARLFERARTCGIVLDRVDLGRAAGAALARSLARSPEQLQRLCAAAELLTEALEVDLRAVQNGWLDLHERVYPDRLRDQAARRWVELFERLAGPLKIALD